MEVVWFAMTERFTLAGSEDWSRGRIRSMPFTTRIVLVPGCRRILRITAGVRFIHAAWRAFSVPSMTRATSESRTGPPFR